MDKKKVIGAIVGVAAFFIAYFVAQQLFFKPPTFDKQMMKTASEINKSCPIMVDAETRLDNTVALPNKTIQYNYTLVNIEKGDIDISEFENYLQPVILNIIKTSPDLKYFRDNDVTMAYNYKDKNGEYLLKLTFKPEDYK